MNYIQQAYKFNHDWWRYLIGLALVLVGIGVFSMPHVLAIGMKQINGTVDASKLEDINYLMTLFDPNLNLVFLLLPFTGGLIFLFLAVKLLHAQSFKSLTTSRSKIDWKRVFTIFFVWGIFTSATVGIDYFTNPENYAWNFDLVPFLILAAIAILLVPLQTSCEEYLFRGYLMQGIGVSTRHIYTPIIVFYILGVILLYFGIDSFYSMNVLLSSVYWIFSISLLILMVSTNLFKMTFETEWYKRLFSILNRKSTPLVITSVIFGLLHIANPEVDKLGYVILIYYIGTGLFLGIMTLMDEGLELAIGFHAANNLFTALLVTADWTAFQTNSILKDLSDPTQATVASIFVPVFVLFPIMLLILSKVYKWSDWKEKLFGKVTPPPKEDYKILE